MIVMAIMSYAWPLLNGRESSSPQAQKVEIASIWMMSLSMLIITLALTVAGIVQIYFQRMPESGQAMGYMATQAQLTPYYWVRLIAGCTFLLGVFMYLYSFVVASRTKADAPLIPVKD